MVEGTVVRDLRRDRMQTTYDRIRAAVQHAKRRNQWESLAELVRDILDRKVAAFRRSGEDDPNAEYVRPPTVRTVLGWARTFGLVAEDGDGHVEITDKGRRALQSEEDFALHVKASVKSHLDNQGLPFADLIEIIDAIALPDAPDAETLAERVAKRQPRPDLSAAELRALLFMLARCGALERRVKVFYGK